MKRIYLLIVLAGHLGFLQAQTWTGASGTDWNFSGNWNPASVPVAGSSVIIPGSLSVYPVLAGPVTINNIEMQPGSRLDMNGYALTLTGINANITFSGAVINNSNPATDIVINVAGSGGFISYFNSNTVNDHITFNLSGSNAFFEGAAAPACTYNGNVSVNISGLLDVYFAYATASRFNGNLSVSRTVAGNTRLFYSGADITGNFSYSNTAGAPSFMGNPGFKTSIGGTVNITVHDPVPAPVELFRLVNLTGGGTISLQHTQGFNLQLDTLLLNALTISGYRGNEYARLQQNEITGTISIADDASYGNGFLTYVRNNLIHGNSSFTVNGQNTFLEADVGGSSNTYQGDLSFISTGAPLYVALGAPMACTGNLSISRTGAGFTSAFNAGGSIGGNFSFVNNTAGNTYLGSMAHVTDVTGTLNIQAVYTTRNVMELFHFINHTNGGSIDIQQSQGFNLQLDTLLVNHLSITGYGGNEYGRLLANDITGNITLEASPDYGAGFATYIWKNNITGNSRFTTGGSNAFYEAESVGTGNRYNGNVSFTAAGTGDLLVSLQDSMHCTGNFTVIRNVAGNTNVFFGGGTILGDFSLTNNAGGTTQLGNKGLRTYIGGKMDITAGNTVPGGFILHRLINNTGAGVIAVANSLGFDLQQDTLRLASLSVTDYGGNAYGRLLNNHITGDVSLRAVTGYAAGFATYLWNNTIIGNSAFTANGSNAFYEADAAGTGNRYTGNVTFTIAGSGDVVIAYRDSLYCTGNLSVIRTTAGNTVVFNGGSTVLGNFSLTNNAGGHTVLGNQLYRTGIHGRIDITAGNTVPGVFVMHRLINGTGGGLITVTNSLGFDLQQDSMHFATLSITGYRGNEYGRLMNNEFTGNLVLADDASYGGGFFTYVRSNSIHGNTSFTINGSNALMDADVSGSGNKYLGNLSLTRNAGSIIAGLTDTDEISGNLELNSAAAISLGQFRFTGSTNTVLDQLSTQPVSFSTITMAKTGTGSLVLNDAVSIVSSVVFTSGLISSSTGKELIFLDNAVCTDASAISFVNGPVKKTGNDAFVFPVGKINKLAPVSITAPALSTDEYRAEYFMSPPNSSGYDSSSKDPEINHISSREYWLLDRTAGSSAVKVTLSWDNSRSGAVTNLADLLVAHWNGSKWKNEGNGGTTGSLIAGTIQTVASVTAFSPFTLASAGLSNPLPVRFTAFTARLLPDKTVALQWSTEEEMNAGYFEVQRSTDQSGWISITRIPAAGAGSYAYTDLLMMPGTRYYRIREVDQDGQAWYSVIIPVRAATNIQVQVWPNPAGDFLYVQTRTAGGILEITDMNGKRVAQLNITGTLTRLYTGAFARGVYVLRIHQQQGGGSIQFLKQ